MTLVPAFAILIGANQLRSETMPIGQITSVIGVSDGTIPQMGPTPTRPFRIHVRTMGSEEFIEISQDAAAALQTVLTEGLKARFPEPSGEVLGLGHHEFIQRVQETSFEPFDASALLMRLGASVQAHPSVPPGPGRHQGATTLAIRMDQAVARKLFQQILALFQRMGWPLPPAA